MEISERPRWITSGTTGISGHGNGILFAGQDAYDITADREREREILAGISVPCKADDETVLKIPEETRDAVAKTSLKM